jgi:hypothetical protein
MWLLLVLSVLPLVALLLAWSQWARHDQRSLSKPRRGLSVLGLVLISAGLLIFLAFSIQTSRTQGWFNEQDALFVWIRAGGWTALIGIVFTLFSRGKSRAWGAASGLLVAGLWFLIGSIPP